MKTTCALTKLLSVLLLLALFTAPLTAANDTSPVWRLQLKVTVADAANGGTNAPVYVRFNAADLLVLNSSDDDFEQNSEFTYELIFESYQPATFGEIDYLCLGMWDSSDPLCVKRLELFINGASIYNIWYARGFWVTGVNPLLISGSTLRNTTAWKTHAAEYLFQGLPADQLEPGLENLIGHFLVTMDHTIDLGFPGHLTVDLRWGPGSGRGAEMVRLSDTSHFVDLDLEITGRDGDTASALDVDLILRWSLSFDEEGSAVVRVVPEIDGVDTDWSGLANILDWPLPVPYILNAAVTDTIEASIAENLEAIEISLDFTKEDINGWIRKIAPSAYNFEYDVLVEANGDLHFVTTFQTTPSNLYTFKF